MMEAMEMIQSVSEELLPGVPKQRRNASHQSLKLDKAYIMHNVKLVWSTKCSIHQVIIKLKNSCHLVTLLPL